MVKVVYHNMRNCFKGKEIAHRGSGFFPFREVPILKKDAIELNHCLIRRSVFDVRNFFSVLATPLVSYLSYLTFVLGAQKNWFIDHVLLSCTLIVLFE